jgi:hypothetical protein
LGADDLVASLLVGGRLLAAAKGHRQRSEPSLGPVAQTTLQPAASLIACLQDPSTRRRKLLDPGLHVGPELGVGGGELGGGGDRLQQRGVLQHGWVVDEGGDRLALALQDVIERPEASSGGVSGRPSASMNTACAAGQANRRHADLGEVPHKPGEAGRHH